MSIAKYLYFKERQKIQEYKLELPLPAIIADKLIEQGVKIRDGVLTERELAEELCRLK